MGAISNSILNKGAKSTNAWAGENYVGGATLQPVVPTGGMTSNAIVQNPNNQLAPTEAGGESSLLRPAVVSAKMVDKANVLTPNNQLAGAPVKPKSYLEMLQMLSPYKPMTPKELEAEKNRQSRNERMSAIGDAIGAIANLWGTSKGAPNSMNPATSMTDRTRRYWDKLNQERQINSDRYNNLMLQAMHLDQNRDNANFNREMALKQFAQGVSQYNQTRADNQARYKAADENAKAELALKEKSTNATIAAQQAAAENSKASNAIQWANYNLKKDAAEKEMYTPIYVGDEKLKVPTKTIDSNITTLFDSLPDNIRDEYMVPTYVDEYGIKKATGKKVYPSADVMFKVITANSQNPETANLLRMYAGV